VSQQSTGDLFIPPPPPPLFGNSMYPPDLLAAKAKLVADETRTALILSIVGLFCAGFILGFLAFRKANDALETIAIYEVAPEKKSIALTAKVLGIIDIVGWAFALVARFVF
jgi:hypothetical protein